MSYTNISNIESDTIKRYCYEKVELTKFFLSAILKNKYTSIYPRARCYLKLSKMCRFYSLTAQRNHCRISGRTHFVLNKARLSRMQFRAACGYGYLAGIMRVGK